MVNTICDLGDVICFQGLPINAMSSAADSIFIDQLTPIRGSGLKVEQLSGPTVSDCVAMALPGLRLRATAPGPQVYQLNLTIQIGRLQPTRYALTLEAGVTVRA